jgi:hypothetical protein
MDHQFFKTELAKIALILDAASFSDHCVTIRPNLHKCLNCSVAGKFLPHICYNMASLVVWWSGLLTTNHEVPVSIPGSAVVIFPCRGRSPQRPWSG